MFRTKKERTALLIITSVVAFGCTFFLPPIHQNPAYHSFADRRTFGGIPNFWNVVTNLSFVVVGIYGLGHLKEADHRLIYGVLVTGILLTGLASAFYHLHPGDGRLVYDRLPMTIVFMSFLSLAIAQTIDDRLGSALLIPLVITGIASVAWWRYSGDLRFYGFIQFYPMLLVPSIYIVFPSNQSKATLSKVAYAIGCYLIAKCFERLDKEVFEVFFCISGHSLKHLFAALSAFFLIRKPNQTLSSK